MRCEAYLAVKEKIYYHCLIKQTRDNFSSFPPGIKVFVGTIQMEHFSNLWCLQIPVMLLCMPVSEFEWHIPRVRREQKLAVVVGKQTFWVQIRDCIYKLIWREVNERPANVVLSVL